MLLVGCSGTHDKYCCFTFFSFCVISPIFFFDHSAEISYVLIMRPFLRYLYCEPCQVQELAELRMGLLRVLLQPCGPWNKEKPSILECQLLQLFCDLVPYFQVRVNCLSANMSTKSGKWEERRKKTHV